MAAKSKKYTGVLFKVVKDFDRHVVKESGAEKVEFEVGEDERLLTKLYAYLGCSSVDCVQFEADGHFYDVWCDDEFLMKPFPVASLIIGEPVKDECIIVCNSYMVLKSNEEGETVSLTPADVRRVWKFIDHNLTVVFRKARQNGLFGKGR